MAIVVIICLIFQYFRLVRRFYLLERVARIELALSGRKHDILPLNYTRNFPLHFYYTLILDSLQVF